ncbi:acetoacetyl-CoA synthetase [Tricholoma matsutake]|nr:acetoacetyl-CoA synthetase [Tricholoma matsutake 945]
MTSHFSHSRLIWKHDRPAHTQVEILRRIINRKHGLDLSDYHDLHKYSVEDYTFWLDLWEFLGIISSVPPNSKRIIMEGQTKEVPVWFPGARLNYAENLLYRNDDAIAITATGESGIVTNYSFRKLQHLVRRMAAALRVNGLQSGDRVAAIVTNSTNAIVIALATISIGAIFSSTATDMGTQGILDRYRQIRPKFVFAETEVVYSGKTINLLGKVSEVIRDLLDKGLQQAVLLPSAKTGQDTGHNIPQSINLSAFLDTGDNRELRFEQLPFDHPVFILYSSGTTGKPKCIVHSGGGVLLQTKKEARLGFDSSPSDTYLQFTTTAWMMWNFQLVGLACGARIILYDGSPFYPDLSTYLRLVNDQGITVLGTSPRFLAEVLGQGIKPLVDIGKFEDLRTLMVTGAVLTPPMFEWAQQAFGEHIHIDSTSGGTDICTSFVTGTPSLPVYAGEIQGKALGMKTEVFDPAGNNIEHTGQPGELVCTRPHPSLPVCFWGDPTGEKFRDAYFSMYPGIFHSTDFIELTLKMRTSGVWRQGDFIVANPATKGLMILGRSDGVLNPSGVRFGSAEIYSVLEKFSGILEDSICVGQRRPQDIDEHVLLFVKMRAGHHFTRALEDEIRSSIRTRLSARHVPSYIFEVQEIPYTVNGKKIEIAVKQIVSGINVQPSATVANPESLCLYYKYRDLEFARAKL